ncbi:hypothetical protein FSST1_002605 [Fusarium sambucinum]
MLKRPGSTDFGLAWLGDDVFDLEFYHWRIGKYDGDDPDNYPGYAGVHHGVPFNSRSSPYDKYESAYPRWDEFSGEVRQCLTRCLRLIADENPEEFGNQVYTSLPHWVGKYPAKEFFDLHFDYWEIPSQSRLRNAMGRLEIPDFVWDLPNTWSHNWLRETKEDWHANVPVDQLVNHNEPYLLRFNMRGRQKINFSAAAAAIRFLGLLSDTQRTQIRSLILHEDAPSVNMMSLHANGLLPFLRENPLLRIERRVNLIDTKGVADSSIHQVVGNWGDGDDSCSIDTSHIVSHVSRWLLDAVAIGKEDIPAGSLTLLLESHPYADACSEAFQQMIHKRIAWCQALRECADVDLFGTLTDKESKALRYDAYLEDGFEEAIMHLVNQTSEVIRCDFDPGVPVDYQRVADEARDEEYEFEELLGCRVPFSCFVDIEGESYKNSVLKEYEFQTPEECFRSRARDSQ